MEIPKYVNGLLGYNTINGRHCLIRQITDYQKYPDCIAGYLYRIEMEKYKYPNCFRARIERFAKWAERNFAEIRIHTVKINGWSTCAVLSITDPVALELEKAGYVTK